MEAFAVAVQDDPQQAAREIQGHEFPELEELGDFHTLFVCSP
jgi:hypothetical protein